MTDEMDIQLSRLRLDPNNSRHPQFSSQREIIEWMTNGGKRVGDKLFALAKDISGFGINPAERIMVADDEQHPDDYIVLEGNRRVTALKLLANPDIAPTNYWKSRFKKLVSETGYRPPSVLSAVVFSDLAAAFHFMEIKHLGESSGAGTVPWDAEQKTRHEQRRSRRPRHQKALILLDHVRQSVFYDEETKDNASQGFPITTLDRMLSDKEFRRFLGLELNRDGELAFAVEPSEAGKAVSKVINDFGSGKKSVRDVINRHAREEYRNSFEIMDIPDHRQTLPSFVKVEDTSSDKEDEGGLSNKKKTYQYPNPKTRKLLVIPGTFMPIDPKSYNRPRRIFDELKNLPIQAKRPTSQVTYPNAVILLLRAFLEMSINAFINAKALTHPKPKGWKDVSLTERAKAVKDFIEKNSLLDSQHVRVLNKILNNPSKLTNPNSLNDFTHNINQVPTPTEIIDIWDTYTPFLSCIWQNIK
jgi:hypothetical protein